MYIPKTFFQNSSYKIDYVAIGTKVLFLFLVTPHLLLIYKLLLRSLSIFPACRSDQSARKWNMRVLRTGSVQNDPAHGSEPRSSPAPVDQSAGIWGAVAGKMYACALDLSI